LLDGRFEHPAVIETLPYLKYVTDVIWAHRVFPQSAYSTCPMNARVIILSQNVRDDFAGNSLRSAACRMVWFLHNS
jgi:hypothetical protein